MEKIDRIRAFRTVESGNDGVFLGQHVHDSTIVINDPHAAIRFHQLDVLHPDHHLGVADGLA